MALTTLPDKTDSSLGRAKIARPSAAFPRVTDKDFEVDAPELEQIKDAILENGAALGLGDGTTVGSLEEHRQIPASLAWAWNDDFHLAPELATQWTETLGAAGTQGIMAADALGGAGSAGVLNLTATGVGDTAQLAWTTESITPTSNPIFRARVLLGTVTADLSFFIALTGQGDTDLAQFSHSGGDGFWLLEAASSTGGVGDSAGGGTVLGSTWYDLRLEIDTGSEVRFYADDSLIGTINTVNAVPRSGDRLGVRMLAQRGAGAGGFALIDYVDVRGTRL